MLALFVGPDLIQTYGVRVATIDPARKVWQCVLLRAISVVDKVPSFKVSGFGDLDVYIASHSSCCEGIPATVGSDDCGV